MAEVLHLRQLSAVDHRARVRREVRRDEREVERRGATDLRSELDDTGIAGEAAQLLAAAAQVRAGRRRQPRVELVEAAPRAHGGDGGREPTLRRRRVVDVVRGDAGDVVTRRELGERVVARRVERIAVVPQLDHDTVAAEQLHQLAQRLARRSRTVAQQRRRHDPLAAAGQHPPVALTRVGEIGQRELRRTLLPREVAEARARARQPYPLGPSARTRRC